MLSYDNELDINYIDHLQTGIEEQFGMGQIDKKTIRAMIDVGIMSGVKFNFAKTVTGPDEWEERTITASENNLFVFPYGQIPRNFWDRVESKIVESKI